MIGFRRWLGDQFWALPMACTVGAVVLALGLSTLDDALDTSFTLPFLFAGGPEGARSLLSAIITSMISFTGLVFSITIVVLQLTSSQFSPRVLRTFLHDRFNQLALGVFVSTFVYGLVVLRSVRGTTENDPYVPQISVTTSFLFILVSVVVFLGYIHHITQTIRAATIVSTISAETTELLEQRHPPDAEAPPQPPLPDGPVHLVPSPSAGVVQRIDDDALLRIAEEGGATLRLVRGIGEFVPTGAPLVAVHGAAPGSGATQHRAVQRAVSLGMERSLEQDVGFGLRQLVDIAERALSPGINDPTTAVQVVDQLHELLRRLATRPLAGRWRTTSDGRLGVLVPQPSFEDYLWLACEEIARWGEDAVRVRRRLAAMLLDLREAARPEHRPAVERALAEWGRDDVVGEGDHPAASDAWLR